MKKLLLRDITYLVFCVYNQYKPDRCETLKKWVDLNNEAIKEHDGDCTDEPQACMRCQYEEILIMATQIRNHLKGKKIL